MSYRSFARFSKLFVSLAFVLACSGEAEESSGTLSGTLVKSIGRAADGSQKVDYHLKAGKQWIRLIAPESVLQSREPNSKVKVQGRLAENGRELTVESLLPDDVVGQVSEALSTTAPKGKVAIFLIKDPSFTEDPFPKQEAIDTILSPTNPTSTNNFFKETSYGAYGLTGDVFGWYEADMTTCDSYSPFTIGSQIRAQAAADGFVEANYRNAIHIFKPNGPECFYAMGTFGAPDGVGESWSYFNTSNVHAHEIGHNLGLNHANGLACKGSGILPVSSSARCTNQEYNDWYDAMGFEGSYYQYNSYTKFLQGWLPESRQQRVTAAGNYTITAQETAVSNSIQSLIIPTPIINMTLHVEMRRQVGAFDNQSRFDGAVLVRRVVEPGLYNTTQLLDMSPEDGDMSNASLALGQTFQDPMTGVSIRLVSQTANTSVIDVALDGPRCSDAVKNGSETDVDCGGLCFGCLTGKACQRQRDCQGGDACSNGVCTVSSGGLTGDYYVGTNFETLIESRTDKFIDFDWTLFPPSPSMPMDQFSVRWRGKVVPPTTATYTFRTDTDDGVRLWVDGQLLIDRWFDGVEAHTGTIALTGGQQYDIVMEYFENGGGAYANLMWSTPTMPLDLIPPTHLLPGVSCSADNAIDLGPRTTSKTVPSNACVKVSQYPAWWGFTNGLVTLQSGTGQFPVPATYRDACTNAPGQFTFNTAWQSQPIGNHLVGCPAVIKLEGNGSPLQIAWW